MAIASRMASRPAILNAISDESTECSLPSNSSTAHVDHRVAERRRRGPSPPRRPSAPRGCSSVEMAPPTILSTNSKPSPRGSGSTRMAHSPNWPWPPDCFLCRPSTSAVVGDRLPVRGPARPRCRPSRRTCARAARWRWPGGSRRRPAGRVWWVSSSRVDDERRGPRRAAGAGRAPSLSSSAWVWALMATASSGSGNSIGCDLHRRALRGQRVAGDGAPTASATAAMSPARTTLRRLLLVAPHA